tara:strand:- start:257 stop:1084 length:828 start_codon:yes stop_codon:yes gene_type:complete
MKHDVIYKTKDYNKFSYIEQNRDFQGNENHIRNLQEKLKKELVPIPLIVNKNYEIIEGQHRLEALKRENLPVYFMILKKTVGTHIIQDLNNTTLPWKTKDHLKVYKVREKNKFNSVECHSQPYHMFGFFMKNYKINLTIALFLLTGKNSKVVLRDFKDGILDIPDWEKSKAKVNFLQSMEVYINKNWKRSCFVTAMMCVYDDYRFSKRKWMHKLELNSRKIQLATNAADYLDMINEIYNWKEQTRVKFSFKEKNERLMNLAKKRNGSDSYWNRDK